MISTLDALIVLAFFAYAAASGLRSRKISSLNLEEYFLAGRTLPGWKAGISMAATQFAADTPLLVTGMIAVGGIFTLWRLWIYALAFLFMGFVLGSAWRRASVLTDAELAELRYGTRLALWLRAVKAVYFGIFFNCTVMAMVLFAATRIAEPFLTWEEWLPVPLFGRVVDFVEWTGVRLTASPESGAWAVRSASNLLSLLAIVAVTALYSTTGGLRAVVNTDLVQFAVAMGATLAYAVAVVRELGGLERIPERLAALYGSGAAAEILAFTPDRARGAGWLLLATIAIQWLAQVNSDGTGYLAQRTMACRSDRDARSAAVIFVLAQILARSWMWIAIALSLLILFPGPAGAPGPVAWREGTFVEGVARYLPAGVKGLMLAGLLAALASTLDTHLNWGASYWTHDIYRRLVCEKWRKRQPSGRTLVLVARLSNLFVLAVSIGILSRIGSIQEAWKASLLLGAGMGGPLILRWVWWRMTAAAELGAILASLGLTPLLLWGVEADGARMLIMAGAATAVTVGIAVMGGGKPEEQVREFYRRVRPPGFWGPVAVQCGDSPGHSFRRLSNGLLETLAASLSVFCALVAVGTWLFGSPAPSWFPWRGAWIASLLLASGGLLLVQKRTLRSEPPAVVRPI